MAKTPTVRVAGSTTTLNQIYIDGAGNINVASTLISDAGIRLVTLSANATVSGAALADWDADTGW
jgi:hypothetical protein